MRPTHTFRQDVNLERSVERESRTCADFRVSTDFSRVKARF